LICDPGTFCVEGADKVDATGCSAGYFCSQGATSATPNDIVYTFGVDKPPGMCPMGFYCPAKTLAPLPCTIGQYQPATKQSACIPCPAGKYCDIMGLDNTGVLARPCDGGYFCLSGSTTPRPLGGDATGKPCDRGYYCPEGSVSMIACPGGRFENRQGSTLCQICPEGYFCPVNSIQPTICSAKHFCPAASET
jgi:hypothetical protein